MSEDAQNKSKCKTKLKTPVEEKSPAAEKTSNLNIRLSQNSEIKEKKSIRWSYCLKKARPLFNSRHKINTHRQQSSGPTTDCVQLYVNEPNYLYRLCIAFPFVCKIGEQTGCGPALLHEVCKERGWKEFQTNPSDSQLSAPTAEGWNLWWQCGKTIKSAGRSLLSWQMTNFTDHKYNFTSKDVCSRFLARLQKSYGSGFDFGPMSFNLPNDYPRLCSEHSKRTKKQYTIAALRSNSAGSQRRLHFQDRQLTSLEPIWICKPVGRSRGRGITVFDTVTKIGYHTQSVVQEYISRPYLIGGYKWDLRIYVCIVSTNPLVIYAYREGIVRFATDQFTLKNLYNPYAHLTNTSLNKSSPSYRHPKEVIGVGCKWTLQKLRRHWIDNNVKDWYLWQRILKILILTIVGDADNISAMSNSSKTFSLFGFDIMVDSGMKPYLLEVNKNPALGHDCEVDAIVKKPMLHDLFDLLGLPNIRYFEQNLEKCLKGDDNSEEDDNNFNKRLQSLWPRLWNNSGIDHRKNGNGTNWAKAPLHPSSSNSCRRGEKERGGCEVDNIKNPYFILNGAPGNRRITPPILVKIPSPIENKEKQKAKNEMESVSSGTPGLMLGVRNWEENSPPEVGDWTRIFPFVDNDDKTEQQNRAASGGDYLLDIRRVMNQMNDYMRDAKHIFKDHSVASAASDDNELDIVLKKSQFLNSSVWHPHRNRNRSHKMQISSFVPTEASTEA